MESGGERKKGGGACGEGVTPACIGLYSGAKGLSFFVVWGVMVRGVKGEERERQRDDQKDLVWVGE